MIAMVFGASVVAAPVYADDGGATTQKCNSSSFLGLRPWYAGLMEAKGGKCELKEVKSDQIAGRVWTIVLNVLADLFMLLGYVSIAMAIYGGFIWMVSKGEPAQVAKGVKTLKYAVMGTIIAALAWVITNTIVSVLTGAIS